MKLYTICPNCRNEVKIKSTAKTRGDLQMEIGEEVTFQCLYCKENHKNHINKVRAETSNKFILIGLVISIFVSIILWFVLGAIGTVIIIIPGVFWYQEMSAVKSFNNYMVRRR